MSPAVGRFRNPRAEARFRDAYREALAALPPPVATREIATDLGRVHVHRFGADGRTPLVLLPGRAGGTTMWLPNLPAWAVQRTVYAVDVLGEAGLSVQERPIRGAADQAAWLGATLEGLGLDRAHLVGVSFGGWLAVNLALHDDTRVASLSLIYPACVFGRFPLRMLLASLATLPLAPELLRNRMLSWISGGAEVDGVPEARVIAAAMREFHLAVPAPAYPSDDQLRGLRVPTLALIAGRSAIHDACRAYARTQLVPGVVAELWPAATHAMSGECADRVTARVLEFVDGTAG